MEHHRNAIICKLLALVAFVFMICALFIIATTGPATGYEISIYTAYPPYFWFFIIASLCLGITILVLQAFAQERSNWWLAGLAIILLSHSIILLLPLFRGYVTVGYMDPEHHVGYIKDIILMGQIGTTETGGENFYPASHLLASSLYFVTSLDIEVVMKLICPLFYGFYIVSMYLLGGELAETRGQQLLVTALAALPLFIMMGDDTPVVFAPRILIFWMLPFIIYLFYRSRRASSHTMGYTALLIITLLIAPFWHPSNGGLLLFGLFLMLGFALWFSHRLASGRAQNPAATDWQPSSVINPAVLVLVTWLIWYMTLWAFSQTVLAFREALVFEGRLPQAQLYYSWLVRANIPLSEGILLFLKKQGHQLPYFLAAGIMSLAIWGRLLFSKVKVAPSLAVFSFLFLASAAAFLLLTLVTGLPFESSRFLPYALLFAAVVIGLGLYHIVQRFRHRAIIAIIIAILAITTAQGVFNTYKSPFTLGANDQITLADRRGMEWFKGHRTLYLIEDFAMNQWSMASAVDGRSKVGKAFRLWQDAETVEHFGYDEHDTYGASFEHPRYFLSHTMSRVIFTERLQKYEEGWRWTLEDWERLENDPTVARLYTSGGFETFLVEARAEPTD